MKLSLVDFFKDGNNISIKDLIIESEAIGDKLGLKQKIECKVIDEDIEQEWTPREYGLTDLILMPVNSLGRELGIHLLNMNRDQEPIHSLTPMKRFPIQHPVSRKIYIRERVRQTHDIMHILTNFNTSQPGEYALQGFYCTQRTTILSTLFMLKLLTDYFNNKVDSENIEAAIEGMMMGIKAKKHSTFQRLEEKLSKDVTTIREELNIHIQNGKSWHRK